MKKAIDILARIYILGTLVFSIVVAAPHGFWAIIAGVFVLWPLLFAIGVLIYAGLTGAAFKN